MIDGKRPFFVYPLTRNVAFAQLVVINTTQRRDFLSGGWGGKAVFARLPSAYIYAP